MVIEGILYEEIYGDVLRALVASHRGVTRCYRFSIPFSETLKRHETKPNATEFGESEMRHWWRDEDPLTGVDETIIGADYSLADSVSRIIKDCNWQPVLTD